MITEEEFYKVLLKEKENSKINIFLEDVEVVPNYKLKDSPDFVLKVRLKLSFLSQDLYMEIPLPIELEKGGIYQALEDLRKFVEREKFYLTLPMLIVSDKNSVIRKEERKMKTYFELIQVPYRLLIDLQNK